MKIGFLNGYTIWGGGEKWHFEMANFCKSNSDEVIMFTPKEGELAKRSLEVGLDICDISIGKASYYNPFFFLSLMLKLQSYDLDVLVFNSFRDVRACALAAKRAGIKKVILRCGMPIAPKESLSYKLNFKYGLDYFVPISNAVQEEFDNKAPNLLRKDQCLPFIANGIDLEDFSYVGETSSGGKVTLGNASRLSHQKGLDMLLPSLKILKDKGISFKMLIAGEGEEREALVKLREDLELEDEVEFIGHTDDVASFVKEVDVYTFTSRYEGTARSIIEAFACGKPVVAFNTSSMKEMVEDSKSGFLVEAFNEEEFAQKIEELIGNKAMREEFGKRGRETVENSFDKSKNFHKWYQFLSN